MFRETVREIAFSLKPLKAATTPKELAAAIGGIASDVYGTIPEGTVITDVMASIARDGGSTVDALRVSIRTPAEEPEEAGEEVKQEDD